MRYVAVLAIFLNGCGFEATILVHRMVRQAMPQLRDALDQAERRLPAFVWRELERFTACGDPKYGFAWLTCGP